MKKKLVDSTELVPSFNIRRRIIGTVLEALTSFKVNRIATAPSKLFMRHVLWHDVIMMCGFTRSGVLLSVVLLLVLVNPLLAGNARQTGNKKEKIRQQAQEERQSEFVKGKSKQPESRNLCRLMEILTA